MERRGVTPDLARSVMRTNTTAIGAIMVKRGEADSLICGTFGQYLWHLKYIEEILAGDGLKAVGALSMMILESDVLFIADCNNHCIRYVHYDQGNLITPTFKDVPKVRSYEEEKYEEEIR